MFCGFAFRTSYFVALIDSVLWSWKLFLVMVTLNNILASDFCSV